MKAIAHHRRADGLVRDSAWPVISDGRRDRADAAVRAPAQDRRKRHAERLLKIQRKLGWTPAYTFETGIRETVRWYLANQPWVAEVKAGKNA